MPKRSLIITGFLLAGLVSGLVSLRHINQTFKQVISKPCEFNHHWAFDQQLEALDSAGCHSKWVAIKLYSIKPSRVIVMP